MDWQLIREARLRWPFVPFRLRTVQGSEFYIPVPEYVAVSKKTVVIVNHTTQVGLPYSPAEIESLEYEKPAEKAV